MNNLQNGEFDIAGKYISPEKIEKAPEGFSERVMIQIRMENIQVRSHRWKRVNFIVPAVAFLTTAVLIAVAVFTNPASESSFLNSVSQLLTNVGTLLPDLKTEKIEEFALPGVVFYIVMGIVILALLDFALTRVFHNRNQNLMES